MTLFPLNKDECLRVMALVATLVGEYDSNQRLNIAEKNYNWLRDGKR